eukprot:scaffold248673_cov37-Tisochrysis_lutea.AAC.3
MARGLRAPAHACFVASSAVAPARRELTGLTPPVPSPAASPASHARATYCFRSELEPEEPYVQIEREERGDLQDATSRSTAKGRA